MIYRVIYVFKRHHLKLVGHVDQLSGCFTFHSCLVVFVFGVLNSDYAFVVNVSNSKRGKNTYDPNANKVD